MQESSIVERLKPMARQFSKYLMSGGMAAALDLGSYQLLLLLGVHYLAASITGNVLGFFSAFIFHKYLVFGKKEAIVNHFLRYCLINVWNTFAQTVLLYLFVEYLGIDKFLGKILGIGCTVSWNFLLYKFFVYV